MGEETKNTKPYTKVGAFKQRYLTYDINESGDGYYAPDPDEGFSEIRYYSGNPGFEFSPFSGLNAAGKNATEVMIDRAAYDNFTKSILELRNTENVPEPNAFMTRSDVRDYNKNKENSYKTHKDTWDKMSYVDKDQDSRDQEDYIAENGEDWYTPMSQFDYVYSKLDSTNNANKNVEGYEDANMYWEEGRNTVTRPIINQDERTRYTAAQADSTGRANAASVGLNYDAIKAQREKEYADAAAREKARREGKSTVDALIQEIKDNTSGSNNNSSNGKPITSQKSEPVEQPKAEAKAETKTETKTETKEEAPKPKSKTRIAFEKWMQDQIKEGKYFTTQEFNKKKYEIKFGDEELHKRFLAKERADNKIKAAHAYTKPVTTSEPVARISTPTFALNDQIGRRETSPEQLAEYRAMQAEPEKKRRGLFRRRK
jgi:hypothetical protein